MRVMVVEHVAARADLVTLLTNLGHEVAEADSNAAAEAALRREHPDVVIAGWGAAGLNGVELCRRVRALERNHFTYFLLLQRREHSTPSDSLTAIEAGVDDVLLTPIDPVEVRGRLVVAQRFLTLHASLVERSSEQETIARQLATSTRTDPLTGLWNRVRLAEDAVQVEARAVRSGDGFCIAVFDVDDFKHYNDIYGRQAGDHVLQRFAQVLRSEIRDSDALYRYGGKAFAVVFTEGVAAEALRAIGRVLTRVRSLGIPHDGNPAHLLTASAGLAPGLGVRGGFASAMRAAETGLLAAKQTGPERVGIVRSEGEPPTVVELDGVR